jgi:hypothetical protein
MIVLCGTIKSVASRQMCVATLFPPHPKRANSGNLFLRKKKEKGILAKKIE